MDTSQSNKFYLKVSYNKMNALCTVGPSNIT